MKRKLLSVLLVAAMVATCLVGCGGSKEEAPAAEGSTAAAEATEAEPAGGADKLVGTPFEGLTANDAYSFQIIVKAYSSTYWQALMNGANDAAADLGVTVDCQGPNNESDVADQVNMFNTAINNAPAGIGIASCDADSCTDSLNQAKTAGVPVVAFDSGFPNAPDGTVQATIATNQLAAGDIAGKAMYDAIKDVIDAPVRIGYVGQDTVSGSHQGRGKGFIDGIIDAAAADGVNVKVEGNDYFVGAAKEHDEADAKIIIECRVPAQPTTDLCATEATALLNKEDLKGIYATGQMSSEAIVSANGNVNKLATSAADGVIGIGFDSGVILKEAVANGPLYGAITQSPYVMGYWTVAALTQYANGDAIQDMDVDAYLYTAENITEEQIASNLYD